jgi:hypothetical protein
LVIAPSRIFADVTAPVLTVNPAEKDPAISAVVGFSVSSTTVEASRVEGTVPVAPALFSAVTMFVPAVAVLAIAGFGYTPDKSPLAVPPGAVPAIAVVVAPVILPCASTTSVGTAVADPYVPGVTAVFARLIVPVEVIGPPVNPVPVAIFVTEDGNAAHCVAPATVVSTCPLEGEGVIFEVEIALLAIIGFG